MRRGTAGSAAGVNTGVLLASKQNGVGFILLCYIPKIHTHTHLFASSHRDCNWKAHFSDTYSVCNYSNGCIFVFMRYRTPNHPTPYDMREEAH